MRRLYAAHRWLGAIAFVQLLIWTASGLFFAVAPMPAVRGEDRAVSVEPPALPWAEIGAPPAVEGATEVTLRVVDGRPLYLVRIDAERRLYDARTGREATIDGAAAERIARAAQIESPSARSVERIEAAPLEYRGKPVPAWRVELDDDRHTNVYVDASTGAVTARRNDLWRAFDFLWSLHIMDYGGRDDTNGALLVGFAALGLVTVTSGAFVWVWRLRNRARKRRRAKTAEA